MESFFATSDFKAHKSQLACIMQLVDDSIKAGKMVPTKQPLRVEDIFLPKKRPANSDSRLQLCGGSSGRGSSGRPGEHGGSPKTICGGSSLMR